MKKLDDQWRQYRDACYPDGLNDFQNNETRQAFFAGALVVLKLAVERAAGLSDEESYKSVVDLILEAQAACEKRIVELKGRN